MSKTYREAVHLTTAFNTSMAKGSPLFFMFLTRSRINVLVVLFRKMTFGMILEAAKGKS